MSEDRDSRDVSLNEEYESLVNKARRHGLEFDASRLTNSYNSIKYHASNPDEDVRKQVMSDYKKRANELKEKRMDKEEAAKG